MDILVHAHCDVRTHLPISGCESDNAQNALRLGEIIGHQRHVPKHEQCLHINTVHFNSTVLVKLSTAGNTCKVPVNPTKVQSSPNKSSSKFQTIARER